MLNGLDLFSGIGGLALALEALVKPVAYCENDRFAQSVLLSRMACGRLPPAPIWDDVRTLDAKKLGHIDIITAGFPCQDISIAGNGKGLEGERSGLFFEIIKLACDLRPSFIFLENVPAISHRGLERILLELTSLGYDSRWTTLSAGEIGAPHLRERWWLLAYANCERLPESRRFKNKKSSPRGAPRDSVEPILQARVWAESPRNVCGMDDGLPLKTHRIRTLGNAVVPHQAQVAFERLLGSTIKQIAREALKGDE